MNNQAIERYFFIKWYDEKRKKMFNRLLLVYMVIFVGKNETYSF